MSLVKYNNNSLASVTDVSNTDGAMILIKTLTASSSDDLSFVDGTSDVVLDNTYPIYLFKFINIHPASNGVFFEFNLSTDSGSNYNVTKTSTSFEAIQNESGATTSLRYATSNDLAQSTSNQRLTDYLPSNSGEDDMCATGELYLFNPSSTTFVKHFISTVQSNGDGTSIYSWVSHNAGYGNTTSAVDAIQFKMNSGTIDSGTIKLYGIKDS